MVLKHRININLVDRHGKKQRVLQGGEMSLPSKVVRLLLGEGMKVLVITPEEKVGKIVISEMSEGGEAVEAV